MGRAFEPLSRRAAVDAVRRGVSIDPAFAKLESLSEPLGRRHLAEPLATLLLKAVGHFAHVIKYRRVKDRRNHVCLRAWKGGIPV